MTRRTLVLASAIAALWAGTAAADMVQGEVGAHDRVAHAVVLKDKTVLSYTDKTGLPEDLKQGDKVEVEFQGSEGDMAQIVSIKLIGQ